MNEVRVRVRLRFGGLRLIGRRIRLQNSVKYKQQFSAFIETYPKNTYLIIMRLTLFSIS